MKNENVKKRALKHIKKGLQHLDINYSLDIKQSSKEIRTFLQKKNDLTENDLYVVLRKKVRKGVSNKWKGSIRWHKECNKILPLLKLN